GRETGCAAPSLWKAEFKDWNSRKGGMEAGESKSLATNSPQNHQKRRSCWHCHIPQVAVLREGKRKAGARIRTADLLITNLKRTSKKVQPLRRFSFQVSKLGPSRFQRVSTIWGNFRCSTDTSSDTRLLPSRPLIPRPWTQASSSARR